MIPLSPLEVTITPAGNAQPVHLLYWLCLSFNPVVSKTRCGSSLAVVC